MDSYFNITQKSFAGGTRRGAAAPSARPSYAPGPGYNVSSDELNAGLDVRTVSITTLPVELVSELIRLRRTWGSGAADIDTRMLN